MPESIFISYRRATSAGSAGRLYDTLSAHFGDEHVFMDVDSIEPGEEFAAVLNETLASCRAVLVVIDPEWLDVRDRTGNRRLDDPADFVRIEIEQSLTARVKVFPVLVDGASMPDAEQLPPPLQPLAGKQAVEISATRFRYDAGRLITALDTLMGRTERTAQPALRRHPGRGAGWDVHRGMDRGANRRAAGGLLPHRLPRWLLPVAGAVVVAGLVVGFLLLQRPGVPVWQDLPDAPVALEGAGMAVHDGRIWVAGGVSGQDDRALLDSVLIYDPAAGSWANGPDLPEPVAFASLVAAGPELYLVGGQAAAGAVRTTLRLDAGAGKWVPEAPLPAAREAGAAAWDGSRIVYAGGVGGDHAASDAVYALAGGAWQRIGKLSIAREKAAAVSDSFGTVWIVGGRDRRSGVPAFGAVDIIQVDGRAQGQPVEPVHSAAAVWVQGAGPCALAGDTGLGVTAAVRCLNGPSTLPPLPTPRAGLAAAALGPDVYVMGGYDGGRHGSAVLQVFHAGS